MSGYDPARSTGRCLSHCSATRESLVGQSTAKPVLLVTQGDPYEERGISAITRVVADSLGIFRALIVLDADIADYHSPNADRYKNICEISYSTLAHVLQADHARRSDHNRSRCGCVSDRKRRDAQRRESLRSNITTATLPCCRKLPRSLANRYAAVLPSLTPVVR